jgi:hypothetical protein
MSADAIGSAGRVRQVDVPASVRERSTLTRIDYADTFLVDIGAAQVTAEQCAREVLEGAPLAIRTQLLSGWSSIGLKISKDSPPHSVLGWQVRQNTPDFILLGADSRIGMPGELMFSKDGDTLLFASLVRHGNQLARAVLATIEPAHVRMVRHILHPAGRRLSSGTA